MRRLSAGCDLLSRRSLMLAGAGALGALTFDPPMLLARQPATTDPASIVAGAVKTFMRQTGTPGVGVALHYQGQDHFYNAGQARPGHPVTEDTVFEIGSVTKTFTATLLAHQVIAGTKQLGDAATTYLPASVRSNPGLQEVTLRDLATHTSGMPDRGGGKHSADPLFAGQAPADALLRWWRDVRLQHPPGTYWLYSNIAFVTLGFAVVGARGGPTYPQLLQRDITSPLGLRHTTPLYTTGPNVAQGYIGNTAHRTTPVRGHASDLKSTPRDMLTWLKAQLGIAPPGTPASLRKAIALTQKVHFRSDQIKFDMGLAWQLSDKRPGQPTVVTKNGAVSRGGFSCIVMFIPDRKIAMAFLTNKFSSHGNLEGVPAAIMKRLIS